MPLETRPLPLAAVESVTHTIERDCTVYLHLREGQTEVEPLRLGTGRNAVVFLATDIPSLQGAKYWAVKFLRDDPDDQVAYSSAMRFFQEALSLQNKNDNINTLVEYHGWGAIARDLTRRGPVNSIKEFWWEQIFNKVKRVSFETNDAPEFRQIKNRFSLQGPFYCLELCHGTLEHLLERSERWVDLPVYGFNQGSEDALIRNARDSLKDIEIFVSRYLQGLDGDDALFASDLSRMSGYDILNAFKKELVGITDNNGKALLDEKGAVRHDPNLIRNHVVLKLFIKIVQSLQHLHENEEAHRDLKPGNIFFKHTHDLPLRVEVKLADLGYVTKATIIEEGTTLKVGSEQAPGSPFYRAPEQADLPIEARITVDQQRPNHVMGKGSKISNIQSSDWLFVADLFEDEGYHLASRGDEDTKEREQLVKQARRQRNKYLEKRFYSIVNATLNERSGEYTLKLDREVAGSERYDLQAQISKGTGFHTDVYSLGAILYDLASGGRNPEHFYTYCLKVFTNQFGVNPELIPESIDEVMEILAPDKTRQTGELLNPFALQGQQRPLESALTTTREKRELGLFELMPMLTSTKDPDALVGKILRAGYANLSEAQIRQLLPLLLKTNDINTLVEQLLLIQYPDLPEGEVQRLLKLLLTTNDVDKLVEEILRSAYVDLPEGEVKKKIRDYRFRTFDVVNTLLTDKRGVPIPREIIRIVVRCMLRDKEQSLCQSSQGWSSKGPNGLIVEELEQDVNKLLSGKFSLPEREFPDRLKEDLLFQLRALTFDPSEAPRRSKLSMAPILSRREDEQAVVAANASPSPHVVPEHSAESVSNATEQTDNQGQVSD